MFGKVSSKRRLLHRAWRKYFWGICKQCLINHRSIDASIRNQANDAHLAQTKAFYLSRAIYLLLWVIFFVHFWAEQAVGQSHLRNSTFLTICEKIFSMGKLMVIVKVLSGFMRPFSICWKVEVLQRENPSSLFILLVLMLLPGKQFFCTVLRALDLKGDILQILSSL